MKGSVEIYQLRTDKSNHPELVYQDDNLIVDGAGAAVADLMAFKRVPSSISVPGSSLIHDTSNFGIKAMSLGTSRDRYHLRDSLYALSSTYALSSYAASGDMSSYFYCKQPNITNFNFSTLPVSQPHYSNFESTGLILKNENFENFIRLEQNGDFSDIEVPKGVPNQHQCVQLGLYDFPGWTVIGNRRKQVNPFMASAMGDVVKTASGINLICSAITSPGNAAIHQTIRLGNHFYDKSVEWLRDADKQKTIQVVFDMYSYENSQPGVSLRVVNKRTGERHCFTSNTTVNAGEWNTGGTDALFTNNSTATWETKSISLKIPYRLLDDDYTFALYPRQLGSLTRTVYSIRNFKIGYLEGWDMLRVDGENTKVFVSGMESRDTSVGLSGLVISSTTANTNHKVIQSVHGLDPDKAYALVFKTEKLSGTPYFNVVLRKRTISRNKKDKFNHFTRITQDTITNPSPPYLFNERYSYDNGTAGQNINFSPLGHPSAVEGILPSDRSNKLVQNDTEPFSFTWINKLDSYLRRYRLSLDTYQVSSFQTNPCYKGYIQLQQKWTPPGSTLETRSYNWKKKEWQITNGVSKNAEFGEDHKFYVGTSSFEDANKWKNNETEIVISTKNGAVPNALNLTGKEFKINFDFYWAGGNSASALSPMNIREAKLIGLSPEFERRNEFPIRYYNWTTNRWSGTSIGAANRFTVYAASGIQSVSPIVPGYSKDEEIDVILEVANTTNGSYIIHTARLCDLSLLPYHGTADINNPDIVTSESEYVLPVWDKPKGMFISWANHAGDLATSSKNYQRIDIVSGTDGYPAISLPYNTAGLRSRLCYQGPINFVGDKTNISYGVDSAASGGTCVLRTTLGYKDDTGIYQYDWDSYNWAKSGRRTLFNNTFDLESTDNGVKKILATSATPSGVTKAGEEGDYLFSIYNINATSGLHLTNFSIYEVSPTSESSVSSIPEYPIPTDTVIQSIIPGNKAYEVGHFENFIEFSSMVANTEESLQRGAYLPASGLLFASGTLGTGVASGTLSGILNQYSVITPSGFILENTTARSSQALTDASAGFITSSLNPSSTREITYILYIPYNEWKVLDYYYGGITTLGLWSMDYRATAKKRLDDPGPPFLDSSTGSPHSTSLYNLTQLNQEKYNPVFRLFAKKALFPNGITINEGTDFVIIKWTIKF